MKNSRDSFTQQTVRLLSDRVGSTCSNPTCRVITRGPGEGYKTINIGVAAHITAAAPGGPRYDPSLTSEQRRNADNGIWLCHNCARMVDYDPKEYSIELLRQWKLTAEEYARRKIGRAFSFKPIKNIDDIKPIKNTSLNSETRHTLDRDKAISLWKLGRESWNQWVEKHPIADIDFRNVDFTKYCSDESPDVDFEQYNFPTGNVFFTNAKFGKNRVYFNDANFNNGDVDFSGATFENDSVSFESVLFGIGDVNFNNVEFKAGLISFKEAYLNEGNYSFVKANFHGHADFSHMSKKHSTLASSFSFNSARFEKALDLSGKKFNCVVDLLNTKTDHHVALCNLEVKLNRKLKFGVLVAKDSTDTSRLRRLKEIAFDNAHYKAALEFHADEMRAMRWKELLLNQYLMSYSLFLVTLVKVFFVQPVVYYF